MKKLTLVKAAIDFSFAHYADGPSTLAIESATAFQTAKSDDKDFSIWQTTVSQYVQMAKQLAAQKLPSEQASPTPQAAPAKV